MTADQGKDKKIIFDPSLWPHVRLADKDDSSPANQRKAIEEDRKKGK
jgi:hypothetical protein